MSNIDVLNSTHNYQARYGKDICYSELEIHNWTFFSLAGFYYSVLDFILRTMANN